MNTQPLPELIAQAQQLVTQIRQHPQYQGLRFDCDVTLADVSQFFNTLQSVNQKVFPQRAIAKYFVAYDTF